MATVGNMVDANAKRREILDHANGLDIEEITEMVMDSVVQAADGCDVEPDGTCCHGYPSPLLVLGMI